MYNFDTPLPRAGSGSVKWDLRGPAFGNDQAVPFWLADSDYPSPPEVVRAVQDAAARCVFGYTAPTDGYRRAVAQWVRTRHGWDIREEWIVSSTGVVSELANIVRCFTAPGDKVLIQTPVYDPFASVIKSAGRTLVENRLLCDDALRYSMDFDDLERDLRSGVKMMILCSPHNPVGRVWTREEVTRVSDLCRRHGVLLVSDEIHWDILMPGVEQFTTGRAGTPENVIVLTAPSKTFSIAGLRCSNDIIPSDALRRKLQSYREARSIEGPNSLGLVACEAAYANCAAWCDEQNAYLAQNARFVSDYLSASLPQIRITPLEGTYLMWLDISASGVPSRELCRILNRAGAILNDGARYGADGFIRLNIACPRDQLRRGLPAIVRGWAEAEK